MKTTVLAAALLAAIAMPAFAEDPVKTDEAGTVIEVDPSTTASTNQSDMKTTVSKDGYSGCMKRHTALMM
jgi:hypothetical protein